MHGYDWMHGYDRMHGYDWMYGYDRMCGFDRMHGYDWMHGYDRMCGYDRMHGYDWMIKVYIYEVEKKYIKDHMDEILEILPSWRTEKLDRLKREESRVISAAAGMLLTDVLEKEYGFKAGIPDITKGRHGKPSVEGVFFNLSHSGNYIALAVSKEKDVGIDIEHKFDKEFRITKRFFTEDEQLYVISDFGMDSDDCGGIDSDRDTCCKCDCGCDSVDGRDECGGIDSGRDACCECDCGCDSVDGSDECGGIDSDRDTCCECDCDRDSVDGRDVCGDGEARFRKIWTMKESCVKLLGAGLSIPLKKLPVDPVNDTADISGFPEYGIQKADFTSFDFKGKDGLRYTVSVCSEYIGRDEVKIQDYGCIFQK